LLTNACLFFFSGVRLGLGLLPAEVFGAALGSFSLSSSVQLCRSLDDSESRFLDDLLGLNSDDLGLCADLAASSGSKLSQNVLILGRTIDAKRGTLIEHGRGGHRACAVCRGGSLGLIAAHRLELTSLHGRGRLGLLGSVWVRAEALLAVYTVDHFHVRRDLTLDSLVCFPLHLTF